MHLCYIIQPEGYNKKMSIQHFIEFQSGQARPDRDKVRVTLNTRGVFLLNKFAYEGMQSPGAVTLHFDPNNQVIGMKPADPQKSNAFRIKHKDKWNNRIVHGVSFCKHFKVNIERTVLFTGVRIHADGTMLIEIARAVGIGKEGTRGALNRNQILTAEHEMRT